MDSRKNRFVNKLKKLWYKNGIYLGIMIVATTIRWVPISSCNSILDEAINDIAIGAFASALVAWLIDCRISRREQNRNEVYRAMLLIPFVNTIVDYMEQFCFQSAFMPPEMRSVKHNFMEWSEYYCNKCSTSGSNDENFTPINADEILEVVQNIHDAAKNIEDNEIWLRKESIMYRQDIQNIRDIDCVLFQYNLLCCTGHLLCDNIQHINQDLCSKLSKTEGLSQLCDFQYSYDCRLSSYIKTVGMIDSIDE